MAELAELVPFIERAAGSSAIAGYRAAFALLQAELGHPERAAATLAPLAGEAVETIPRNRRSSRRSRRSPAGL